MRAAQLLRPEVVVVGDVPDPEPGPGEVRIAVGGVGLCGSDLAVYLGKWTPPSYPWTGGHEAFGTIEAVGGGVPASRVGERVVVEPNIPCGRCDQCAEGRTSACRQRESVGMNRPGALAELLVVPAANAWVVPDLDQRDLACVEPLAVVEAALRRLGGPVPSRALVIGTGSQGLLMTVALRARGAEVLAHDLNAARMRVARSLGAAALQPDAEPQDVGLSVLTVGHPQTMELALRHTAIGGTILVLGLEATPFELSAQTLVRRQLVIRGSLTYDHPADFAATVGGLTTATHPGRAISDEFGLEDVARAYEASRSAPGKTWIRVAAAS